jgi:hypothetical protein
MVRALLRAGLRPPALWIALAGVALVVGVLLFPPLAGYASAVYILAGIALVAWLAMAATQVEGSDLRAPRYSRGTQDPYMRRALERRDALAAELQHLNPTMRGSVTSILERVDDNLLPDFETRVRRHRALEAALQQQASGQGPLVGASASNIARLNQLADDQRMALDGILGRLSDMTASLMGLSQEADQTALAEQARDWADELGSYWEATEEVFRPTSLTEAGGRG